MTTGVSMNMYERWLKEEHDNHNETKMKLQQAELEIERLKQQLEAAKWSLRYEQQLRAGESWSYSK